MLLICGINGWSINLSEITKLKETYNYIKFELTFFELEHKLRYDEIKND